MKYFFSIVLFLVATSLFAQKTEYTFKDVVRVATTSVKNQGNTGTCWSFASTSFIESEALRITKDTFDLAEMYFVRRAYPKKAVNYVALKGKANHSEGGLAHDVTAIVSDFGILPQTVYSGKKYKSANYNHSELDKVLKGIVTGVTKGKKHTSLWLSAYEGILNTYLGEIPTEFEYEEKWFTPQAFAREKVGFRAEDYVELTSFTHEEFYKQFAVEVPDNWNKTDTYYNLPLDELMEVFDHALKNGYSINWDGDVSENEFSHKQGVAILPEKSWKEKDKDERKNTCIKYEKEAKVTPELRQKLFESKKTTDDHLMHIVGISEDEKGRKYYITKNSWGDESNSLGGYLHMSENYVMAKTIAIMVHKDAIPKKIAEKIFK